MQYELTAPEIFRYFADMAMLTAGQIVALFLPSLALIVLLHFVSTVLHKHAVDTFGLKWFLYIFGRLGVAVHELGHLIFSVLFFQLVSEVQFFRMPKPGDPRVGWVDRAHINSDFDNFKIGSFFVGIGPALIGTLAIYFFGKWLLGAEALQSLQFPNINLSILTSFENFKLFAHNVIEMVVFAFRFFFLRPEGIDWRFVLFLYIACSIGSTLALSRPDIRTAIPGFITIFVAMFVLNTLTVWAGTLIQDSIAQLIYASRSLYGMLMFVLMINVFLGAIVMVTSVLASTVRAIFFRR